jgi:hypothetical protein
VDHVRTRYNLFRFKVSGATCSEQRTSDLGLSVDSSELRIKTFFRKLKQALCFQTNVSSVDSKSPVEHIFYLFFILIKNYPLTVKSTCKLLFQLICIGGHVFLTCFFSSHTTVGPSSGTINFFPNPSARRLSSGNVMQPVCTHKDKKCLSVFDATKGDCCSIR